MAANDALLDLDSRRKIFRHIEDHPGLHLRGLQRSIGMPLGTIEYHLHQMEKAGLIVSRDDGRFKAFFAKDGLDRRDKDILYYVRQEMPRQIVIQLLMEPGLSHTELTASLPVSASTCSFHLKKLVKADIVLEERAGRAKRFSVREAERVAAVLVRYRRSFLDDLVDRFARAWLDLGHGVAAGSDGAADAEDTWIGDGEVETELITPRAQDEEDAPTRPVKETDVDVDADAAKPARARAAQGDDHRRRPPGGSASGLPPPDPAPAPAGRGSAPPPETRQVLPRAHLPLVSIFLRRWTSWRPAV